MTTDPLFCVLPARLHAQLAIGPSDDFRVVLALHACDGLKRRNALLSKVSPAFDLSPASAEMADPCGVDC